MDEKFSHLLLRWHQQENSREMPWKGERDPYKIWLSEVILQQTRVAQGWAYYLRFIQRYPTIEQLAKAPDQDVFKLWEGLGYYTRCRNLLFTARLIAGEYKGIFPSRYEDILALKGVGPYTAAAIASFAYDLPYAVVDGNVFRVLSRYFGIDTPTDSAEGKLRFSTLAQEVLPVKEPGEFNQAIMDFGATVCKPFSPACNTCPLQNKCVAFNTGRVNSLPVKEKTLTRRNRCFTYFIFRCKGKTLIRERINKDIWQNLFEFYLLETDESVKWTAMLVHEWLFEQMGTRNANVNSISKLQVQDLTHQQIRAQFIVVELVSIPALLKKDKWETATAIQKCPFPKLITQYLAEHPL